MKKIAFLISVAVLLVATACDDETIQEILIDENLETFDGLKFNNFEEYHSLDSSELKSTRKYSFKNLYDLLELAETYNDEDDTLSLNRLLEEYSSVISVNKSDEFEMVTENPKLLEVLNWDGEIQVADTIYKFTDEYIYTKYYKNGEIIEGEKISRNIDKEVKTEDDVKLNQLKSSWILYGHYNWSYSNENVNVSDYRRVSYYKFIEYNGSFGLTVGGRIYYKKKNSLGKWKRCNTDLRMQFYYDYFKYWNTSNVRVGGDPFRVTKMCYDDCQIRAVVNYIYVNQALTKANGWTLKNAIIYFWRSSNGTGTRYEDDGH